MDYIKVNSIPYWDPLYILEFNGDDSVIMPTWMLTDYGWYSGANNLQNSLLAGEIYVDGEDPVLTFTSYWDIELFWDFGFVQISEDNGETWTSLEFAYTTDLHASGAHPNVLDNLPGITGFSEEWINVEIDLSAYAGKDVMLGFRYVTDWNTLNYGWFVDNVVLSGVDVELFPVYPPAEFRVTLIEVDEKNKRTEYAISEMSLDDFNDGQFISLLNKADYLYIVITTVHHEGLADYGFELKSLHPYGLTYRAV